MEISKLEEHLRTLISLEETESPVVSFYIDRRDIDAINAIREQIVVARKALTPETTDAFDRAVERIVRHVRSDAAKGFRSLAVFARDGSRPFFLALGFDATLPNRFFVDSTPVIFHLVELKDNFHRFVLMISTEESARILEVSLGAVTRELWTRRPELRKRVGREWTKRHYQNHRRDRNNRFIKEKIALLEQIARSGGHTHIILAGSPHLVARVRQALPPRLADLVLDIVPATARDRMTDVVESTLSAFLAQEESESQELAERLQQEILRDGLAVAGYEASKDALESGQADTLLLVSDDDPARSSRREELIRLAHKTAVDIEVVEVSDFLSEVEGVGCLLRYQTPRVRSGRLDAKARVT